MARTSEGEPTTQIIFHSGRNGALQPEFAGVEDGSVFDTDLQIYRPRNGSDKAKGNGIIQPTGGVIGGTGGSVFDPETMQYVPIEELKP